jgi:Bifunctional DNA primase/polymerase, N-terminal
MSDAFANAAALAVRGYRVLPCHGVIEAGVGAYRCACGSPACAAAGKHPVASIVPRGLTDATDDEATIERWHARAPTANWGVVCGDLVCIDQDGAKGAAAIGRWLKLGHVLPNSWQVSTGRDAGRHYYFKAPPGVEIRSSASRIAKHIDVRGVGSYSIVPGSLHASGRRYDWWSRCHPNDFDLAYLPAWLVDLIQRVEAKPARPTEYYRKLAAATVPEGERHDRLLQLIGHLAANCIDATVTGELVAAWNVTHCTLPLPADELVQMVGDVYVRELRKRVA